MGTKGARRTSVGAEAAQRLVTTLEPLEEVTVRSMFGGHGIFKADVMFAIVDSEGRVYLRADASTAATFEAAGSTHHARMPYWEVPASILEDAELTREWASTAARIAEASKG